MTPHRKHIDDMNDFYALVQRTAELPITPWQQDVVTHFADLDYYAMLFAPKAEKPNVKYVLASGEANAQAIAVMIELGLVPDLYLFACDCLRAWRESGLVEQRRYQPWAVTLETTPGGPSVGPTIRLGDR